MLLVIIFYHHSDVFKPSILVASLASFFLELTSGSPYLVGALEREFYFPILFSISYMGCHLSH